MATLTLKKPSNRVIHKPLTASRYLHDTYPGLFGKPVPLAVNIHKQFRPLPKGLTMVSVRDYLKQWCHRPEYLEAVIQGGPRYGVNGVEGEVTAAHIGHAKKYLSKRKEK